MTIYTETPPIAGPGLIGQLAAIGIGDYTDIVAIYGPSEVEAGQTVTIQVAVKNLHTTPVYIASTGRYDGQDFAFSPEYASVGQGATYTFTYSFPMLNHDVRIDVWSFYWTGSEWYEDDHEYVAIRLAVPLAGTITALELEYDGEQNPIPVYNIPQGQRALVHIWGRNDMATNQKLCLSWEIKDPDGIVIEQGYDWETYHTSPGGQHHFIMPPGVLDYLHLDKPGTYTIDVGLIMNPSAPTVVDTYTGNLCTVAEPAPPVFEGTITKKELEYNGEQVPIPAYNITQSDKGLVHIWGRNDMATNQKLCLSWEIKDPDNQVVEQGYDWETYHTGPGGQHHFILPPGATDYLNLNKEGSYTISLELLMNPDSPESVDTYQGVLCTVTAAPPPEYEGTITKKELEYNGEQDPIPCDVLVGLHGLVHVWGRNDMATNQTLCLSWEIKDPDGIVIEQGTDWSTLEYLPGREHHFILPPGIQDYVEFDKLGTYTMKLELLMNPDNPVVVADYDGSLCMVTSEVPPEYELIQHTIYPHAYFYEGEAEVGLATFSLPVGPPPIVDWIGNKIINSMAEEVEKEGSRMLELKVYRRTTLPWVNYRLEATAAVTPQDGVAVWPVLIALPWVKIITAVAIAAIIIAVFQLAFLPVLRLFFGRQPGLSEEVKKQWTKETLIGCIIDLRPAYSRETLEAMSDQEVRDVLNEVYEEEVPLGGIPWWGWAIIGGLGIGGGALALKYLPKKKKGPEKKKKEVE